MSNIVLEVEGVFGGRAVPLPFLLAVDSFKFFVTVFVVVVDIPIRASYE